ncbi:MAG: 6-phospho-3-hexuloisomerase [Treponema sp.]|nr:6-phospho-3-hexuloisomerase [Treponema sp.]
MKQLEYVDELLKELSESLHSIDDRRAEALADEIMSAKNIFITGSGRSGLGARGFAMRLMHMGFSVYVAGETVTPALHAGDLLIVCSGSGETPGSVIMAQKAKQLGGKVALVTITSGSAIGRLAGLELFIQAPTPKLDKSLSVSIQPMASLFEQCVLLVLDMVILKLMKRKKILSAEMMKNHANLE